jgi:hypothetical protein
MPESLTPPQGLIAVTKRTTIYGLPMGVATGGGNTKVSTSLPPAYKAGGGMGITLIPGDWYPAVLPPVVEFPSYTKSAGSGNAVSVTLDSSLPSAPAGGSMRVLIVEDVVNVVNGGGGTFVSAQL